MTFNPDIHHRHSLRLQGYDYFKNGGYFITLCTQNRMPLFGEIKAGKMQLNDAGKMIQRIWTEIPLHYSNIQIDAFIIMPDHIHGVIIKVSGEVFPGQNEQNNNEHGNNEEIQKNVSSSVLSLADLISRFKTMSTKCYSDRVKQSEWPPFLGKLWQRNYWEHIVRNELDLKKIREYIENNPIQWELDILYKQKTCFLDSKFAGQPQGVAPT